MGAAHNLANGATPAYKRVLTFANMVRSEQRLDLSAGSMSKTGRRHDVAIDGAGFFALLATDGRRLSRDGHFTRGTSGVLTGAQGLPVQSVSGSEIVLPDAEFRILEDGVVIAAGEPVGQIAIMEFSGDTRPVAAEAGLFAEGTEPAAPVERPRLRLGMLEASNVSMSDDMATLMEAGRQAELGQRLVHIQDEMMERVLTTIGQPA